MRDEWQPVPGKLLLSLGARLDYSLQTRFEFQPTVRLLFTPGKQQSAWFAVSRAARMPNRFDRDMHIDAGYESMGGFPVKIDVLGSVNTRSETEYSTEAGYRYQSRQRWSLDTTLFWSYYPRLCVLRQPVQPEMLFLGGVPVGALVALRQTSSGTGRSWGSESSMILQVRSAWRLIPSWSYLNEHQWMPPASAVSAYASMFTSSAPHHQVLLRSQHTVARHWQIDGMARARSRNTQLQLPGGLHSDVRLAWRPGSNWELSGTLRNLTGLKEFEAFSEAPFVSIPVGRTFTFRLTLQL